jgi:transposase-like protein
VFSLFNPLEKFKYNGKINGPDCYSTEIVKNGPIGNGKQKYKCKRCGGQFVLEPKKQTISDEKKAVVDRLLLERVPLSRIASSAKVSARWLQYYVNICKYSSKKCGFKKTYHN